LGKEKGFQEPFRGEMSSAPTKFGRTKDRVERKSHLHPPRVASVAAETHFIGGEGSRKKKCGAAADAVHDLRRVRHLFAPGAKIEGKQNRTQLHQEEGEKGEKKDTGIK